MRIGIKTTGLKEYTDKLSKLNGDKITGIMKMGLYDGAAVGTQKYKSALRNINIAHNALEKTRVSQIGIDQYIKDYPYLKYLHADESDKISGVPEYQVSSLVDSVALEKMTETKNSVYNFVNVNGYDGVPTKKYPRGVPNRLILRAIEHGTSFRNATNIVDHAKKEMANQVRNVMRKTIVEEVKKELD